MKLKTYLFISILFYSTLSFCQTVNQEWTKDLRNKSGKNDLKVKVDSEGFIYSAGTFKTTNHGTDWNLTKCSPNNDTLFSLNFNGTFNSDDFLNSIEIDSYDNIYLTGSLKTSENVSSPALFKIDYTGKIVWEKIIGSTTGINEGIFLLIDSAQNVFVAGNLNSTDSSKVFVNEYNSSGTLLWNAELNSNDIEYVSGFKKYNNGKIGVLCNVFRSQNWDILLLCLDTTGTINFQVDFKGNNAEDNFCNDFVIDENNNAYATGYTVHQGYKDFLTIKWNSSGDTKWYAIFDDNENNDEAKSMAISGDNIIVTGNCINGETGNEQSDIVTIQYNSNGVQNWKQKFRSRENGNDLAVKIIPNGINEFILIAQVYFTESYYDTYMLNYSFDGDLKWSTNYNDSLNGNDLSSDIAIDFLGNIYVALNTQFGNDTIGTIIKYNQPDKYIPVLKNFLKTLAVGLIDVSTNTIVKNVVYEQCASVVDSFYNINYSDLINKCNSRGLNLKASMNNKISNFFQLPAKDYVDYILKRFWILGYKRMPLVAVPHYHHFNSQQFLDNPKLAYSFEEKSYPVPCLNCNGATIDKATTESILTWLTVVGAPQWYYINGNPLIYITSCSGQLAPMINNRCMVCPSSTAGQIPQATGSFGTQGHEIEITLGSAGVRADDQCYSTFNVLQSYYPCLTCSLAYARLMRVGDMPYYYNYYKNGSVLPAGEHLRISKVAHPIYDREYYSYITLNHSHFPDNDFSASNLNTLRGDVLSICDVNTLFNGLGENVFRYGLAHGLYRLDRPGINQKPIFFAFPYSQGIWFTQGPDMGIFYGTDYLANICATGQEQIAEYYRTEQCEFCNIGPQTMHPPITPGDVRKYIASTDYTTFYNYWSSSVISVGIRFQAGNNTPAGTLGIPGLNLLDFTAVTSPTPCTPTGTLVGSLTVLPNGEYQVCKDFNSGQKFIPGTTLKIHVVAKFNNGKSIDECQTMTLAYNNIVSGQSMLFENVVVNIRGDIKDYSAATTNYLIEIYQ